MNLADQLTAFEHEGYLCLEGVFTAAQVAEFRELRAAAVRDWRYTNGSGETPEAVTGILERYPRPAMTAVADPALLAVAEGLMGPMVQLDSVVLVGAAPVDVAQRGDVVCWHRDKFGFFPLGAYTRPLALIAIAYLQHMTDAAGPLRVIPGSHRLPVRLAPTDVAKPHPDEVMVHCAPGDVVLLHHNLLHSGTRNTSTEERQFLGFVYSLSSLRQEDNFNGPNCLALLVTARRTHDRRMLRLLGEDDLIFPRQNSGFLEPHDEDWRLWVDEDDQYAARADEERRAVQQARRAGP